MYQPRFKDIANLIVRSHNYRKLLITKAIKNLIATRNNMKSIASKMFLVNKIYLKVKLMINKNVIRTN